MPSRGRLSALVSLILLAMALSLSLEVFSVELPRWSFSRMPFGSELTTTFSGSALMAGLFVALAAAGMNALVRSHPQAQGQPFWDFFPYAALPSLLAGAGLLLVYSLSAFLPWPVGLALVGMLLYLVFAGEYAALDPGFPRYNLLRLGLNAVNLVCAFLLYSSIYQNKARSLESATAVLAVTLLLALDMLKGKGLRTWLYAMVVALALGELTWALNYTGLSGPAGGGLLALAFYLTAGPLGEHLEGELRPRARLEFALVGLVGLAALLASIPLRW